MRFITVFALMFLFAGCSQYPTGAMVAEPLLGFVSTAGECHPMQKDYRQAIVKLDTFSGTTASGVVIAKNRVITVAHAIQNNTRIYAGIGDNFHEARLISIDKRTDLAYLEVETLDIVPLALAEEQPTKGESVWATSFPLASSQRVSTGFFEEVTDGRLYATVHINSGSSGGGLLRCEQGMVKLAGVIHGFVALNKNGNIINIGDSTSVPVYQIRKLVGRSSSEPDNNQYGATVIRTNTVPASDTSSSIRHL